MIRHIDDVMTELFEAGQPNLPLPTVSIPLPRWLDMLAGHRLDNPDVEWSVSNRDFTEAAIKLLEATKSRPSKGAIGILQGIAEQKANKAVAKVTDAMFRATAPDAVSARVMGVETVELVFANDADAVAFKLKNAEAIEGVA